jgi:hypothetical protein
MLVYITIEANEKYFVNGVVHQHGGDDENHEKITRKPRDNYD